MEKVDKPRARSRKRKRARQKERRETREKFLLRKAYLLFIALTRRPHERVYDTVCDSFMPIFSVGGSCFFILS